MTDRDLRQLKQAMERLLSQTRWLHGLALTNAGETWSGHTSIIDNDGPDKNCESCGVINQAEYELASLERFMGR